MMKIKKEQPFFYRRKTFSGLVAIPLKAILLAGMVVWILVISLGCKLFFYEEYNPNSSESIDIIENGNRLVFGTSTGDFSENWVEVNYSAEEIDLYARNATNNAGKIAGSEDGITFFFKEVEASRNFKMSASVKVISFGGLGTEGETTSNGQEGFGLMARDFIPQYSGYTMIDVSTDCSIRDSEEYKAGSTGGSSNMVMVGGIKRGVRAAMRQGVTAGEGDPIHNPADTPDASLSLFSKWPEELADYSPYPTLEDRPDFPLIGGSYRLILEKDNNGFTFTIIPPPEKGSTEVYTVNEPDILTVINEDHYYVGFFAARAAEIVVSNISYSESAKEDDAPLIEVEDEEVSPSMKIISSETCSDGDYKLYATANVDGFLSVSQNGKIVTGAEYITAEWRSEPSSDTVQPYSFFDVPVYTLEEGENIFQVIFYPNENSVHLTEEEQLLSNNDPIKQTFLVERRSFFNKSTPVYVSPSGTAGNIGTESSPLDLQTAIDFLLPGQTIIMKDGIYKMLSFKIDRYNRGTYSNHKRIEAEHRDQVIIDFDKNINASGAIIWGDYWEISGIHIRNTPDKVKGFQVKGNYNLIEWVKTYNNGDTGLQISGVSTEPKDMWPQGNLISFCESYNNKDAAQTDADGFAAKLTVGEGNVFEWCISHNNGDDGWDLFTKKETGPIGIVTIENCISYQNGLLIDGTPTLAGRNGFKLGGEGLSVAHQVSNCLAFQNGAHGFTSNSNPGIQLSFCTSFDNGGRFNEKQGADSRNFTIYDGSSNITDLKAEVEGLLSLYTNPDEDGDGVNRKEDKIDLQEPNDGFVWRGAGDGSSEGTSTINDNGNTLSVDSIIETGVPLWNADFIAEASPLEIPDVGTVYIGYIKRDSQGHFDLADFLNLKEGELPSSYPFDPPGCDFY